MSAPGRKRRVILEDQESAAGHLVLQGAAVIRAQAVCGGKLTEALRFSKRGPVGARQPFDTFPNPLTLVTSRNTASSSIPRPLSTNVNQSLARVMPV